MPPQTASRSMHGEDGTASIELIGVIPFLLLAVLVAAQLVLVGGSLWSAGVAARAGARAALVGDSAEAAVRRALPPSLRRGAEVEEAGEISVQVPVPYLLPGLPQLTVRAESALDGGDG